MQSQSRRTVVALAALLAAACGADPTPPAVEAPELPVVVVPRPASLSTVRIEPRGATLELADSVQLRAVVTDPAGRPVVGETVVWRTVPWAGGPPLPLTVDSTGLVRGGSTEASFQVIALAGNAADTATVSVRSLISLYVWPDTNVLYPGMSRPLSARRWNADGYGVEPLTEASWSSSDPGVVTVDAQGRATAVWTARSTAGAA